MANVKYGQRSENIHDEIIRKNTKVYRLAKLLGDKRRKNGVTRQEVIARLGFDPAPYVKMYACFVAVERGRYTFVGDLSTAK